MFDDDDVRLFLKAAVEREGSQVAFARRHGLERTSLNMVLNGKRPVSEKIIKALGLRKVYTAQNETAAGPPRPALESGRFNMAPRSRQSD